MKSSAPIVLLITFTVIDACLFCGAPPPPPPCGLSCNQPGIAPPFAPPPPYQPEPSCGSGGCGYSEPVYANYCNQCVDCEGCGGGGGGGYSRSHRHRKLKYDSEGEYDSEGRRILKKKLRKHHRN